MKTARRDRLARARIGTLTKYFSRMTDGMGIAIRSEWRAPPSSWRISAFCLRTRTTARRIGTTHKGSYVALRTRALPNGAVLLPLGERLGREYSKGYRAFFTPAGGREGALSAACGSALASSVPARCRSFAWSQSRWRIWRLP